MAFELPARWCARFTALALLSVPALPARAQSEAPAAAPASAAAPSAAASAPPPVRVTYIPEPVRQRLKDELREELLAEGRREGWARAGSVPGWVRTLRFEGDLRTRLQFDNYADDNFVGYINVNETNRTRTPVLANQTVDRQRLRVRARLGANATLDEHWGASLRLTSGSTSDPLSSNQTLGNYGNRFTVAFDRANVRYAPMASFSTVVGRFGNPWFGTDLVWANDLGFDGIALQLRQPTGVYARPWLTAAVMPVQEVELSGRDKWLFGLQAGVDLPGTWLWSARLGVGYYHYKGITGRPNAPGSNASDFTAPAFAQSGNTLGDISSDGRTLLALASNYHLVNVTGSMSLLTVGDKTLTVTADWVRNIGWRESEAAPYFPAGTDLSPQVNGYLLRLSLGDTQVDQPWRWQAFASYKHVERDAVLDAFTDSDLRGGGTDIKGIVVGATLGVGRNSAMTLRWLSGDAISGPKYSLDSLQLELQVRF